MLNKILPVILLFTVAGCGGYSATDFNTTIVNKHSMLNALISIHERETARLASEGKNDSIVVMTRNLIEAIDRNIDELRYDKVPAAKSSGQFTTAAIKFFETEKKIGELIIKFDGNLVSDSAYSKLDSAMQNRDKAFEWFQYAQEKFAYDNGLKLQKSLFE